MAPREVGDATVRWVKPARQERSRDTHDRIVDAAERLLARGRSWTDLTIAELVKEAGTSVGAFYNRFRDKDALLHVLQLELYREGEATAVSAQAFATSLDVPLETLVRAFVALAVSAYREQYGLRRALALQMASEPTLRERAVELSRMTCEGLTDALAVRLPGRDRGSLRTIVDVSHRMLYGVLDQNLMFSDAPTSLALADATLVDELTIAVLAYLERRLG
ncbi:MAG TPA: TetR/AcrR family transcriptional regulator [Kofleriaceae bacterium]|nr:TetR/AcrR family transcriptional regulator [Kofleriaceae bacterium]